MRCLRWALVLVVPLALPPTPAAARQDRAVPAGHGFTQAGGVGGKGYLVSDEGGNLAKQTRPFPDPAALPLAAVPMSQPAAGRRVLAYYVPYDPTSWATLVAHPEAIDVVAAQ